MNRPHFTPREHEIIGMVCKGMRNREIATVLGTTEAMIKNYIHQIFNKAGCDSRLELAMFTLHHGWLQ